MNKILFLLLLVVHAGAVAQPSITMSDLDFGTVGAGVPKLLAFQICNVGSDSVRFIEGPGGEFVTWLRRTEFTVAPADIEKLATTAIGPGRCLTFPVTFISNSEGD